MDFLLQNNHYRALTLMAQDRNIMDVFPDGFEIVPSGKDGDCTRSYWLRGEALIGDLHARLVQNSCIEGLVVNDHVVAVLS